MYNGDTTNMDYRVRDTKEWGDRVTDNENVTSGADELKILPGDDGKVKVKRKIKDSVFLNLFSDKKYLLQLYQVLHPEDIGATEDALDIVTIENILTDNIYNDLGVRVGDRLIILVEAQSTWSMNILVRILLYLAKTYQNFIIETKQDLYSEKKVRVPKPEFYVIFTGERKKQPEVISFSEEFFGGADIDVEIKAKVIYQRDTNDIIDQYIVFCKVFDEQRKKYGYTEKAIRNTINICKDRNVLREYLESREKEIVTIMITLFSEDEIREMFLADYKRRSKKEADLATAERLIKKGEMSLEDIADCIPTVSIEELKHLQEELLTTAGV
jgi:hypothetical protein